MVYPKCVFHSQVEFPTSGGKNAACQSGAYREKYSGGGKIFRPMFLPPPEIFFTPPEIFLRPDFRAKREKFSGYPFKIGKKCVFKLDFCQNLLVPL